MSEDVKNTHDSASIVKAVVVCAKFARNAEELQMFVQMLDLVDH